MDFFRSRPLVIIIIVVIALLLALILTTGKIDAGTPVGRVVAPVQQALYSATQSIGNWFSDIFSSDNTKSENADLKVKIANLERQLYEYESIKDENERLKDLISMKEAFPDYEMVGAYVISKTPGEWYDQFIINIGTDDGIGNNMAVITNVGLVGIIIEASPTYSKVMTIADSRSGVPSIIERTRDNCVVQGGKDAQEKDYVLLTRYLDEDADVLPGDIVVTSGMGGVYPKGITVGEVYEVSKSGTDSSERSVLVRSSIDFNKLTEVLVVKSSNAS